MGRLTEGFASSANGIGREQLINMINTMNTRRAEHGIRERYKPEMYGGAMHAGRAYIPHPRPADSPSPIFNAERAARSPQN